MPVASRFLMFGTSGRRSILTMCIYSYSDDRLPDVLGSIIKSENIDLNKPATVSVAMDTR